MSEIIYIEEADSSNNLAFKMLDEKPLPEFSIIWVGNQTSGRGQGTRKWFSNPGENITMTAILYPNFLSLEQSFYLSKIVALSTRELISQYCSNVFIKWPNDIYVRHNKISGILIENRLRQNNILASIVGVGINVNQKKFPSSIPNPTSLIIETNTQYDLKEIIYQWQKLLIKYYNWLKNKDFEKIDDAYHQHLYLKSCMVEVQKKNNEVVKGKIIRVNEIGELELETDNKRYLFAVGEAELLFKHKQ